MIELIVIPPVPSMFIMFSVELARASIKPAPPFAILNVSLS
jgi:hypothetical protein